MLFRSVLWMTTRRVFNISNPGFLGGEKLCDFCSLAMLLLHSTCLPSSAFSNFLSSVHKQMSYPLFFLTLCSHFTQIAVPTSEQCPFPLPCLCLMGDFRFPWKWTSQSSAPTPPSRTTRMESNLSFTLPEGKYPVLLKNSPGGTEMGHHGH